MPVNRRGVGNPVVDDRTAAPARDTVEARDCRLRQIGELGRAVAETEAWIDDLAQRLGWRDRDKTYGALIGALHGLRDALPRDEVVYPGAQLPPLLRGFYYEGWRPGAHRSARSASALCGRLHEAVDHDPGVDLEAAARAVLAHSWPACRRAKSKMYLREPEIAPRPLANLTGANDHIS